MLPRPTPQRRRAPLADAVEREDRGLVERAREERAGRVALVMIGEDERRRLSSTPRPSRMTVGRRSFSFSQTGIAMLKLPKPRRRERQVGLEQALELAQRLLVEHDVVDVS